MVGGFASTMPRRRLGIRTVVSEVERVEDSVADEVDLAEVGAEDAVDLAEDEVATVEDEAATVEDTRVDVVMADEREASVVTVVDGGRSSGRVLFSVR